MNSRYVTVCVSVCVCLCVCAFGGIYNVFRFEDFVQMVVSNSRGGSSIDFEYDAVSYSTSPVTSQPLHATFLSVHLTR